MAIWGLIVASLLIIGSLPFFVGLAVVVPVLGHSTWHLYRKVVEPDPSARHEHLAAPKSGRRRYAAQFPAALFGGEEPPRPVYDPATCRWRASRTARPEVILACVAAGTVIALVGTFLWAEVWATLGVVFVAAVLMLVTAALLAAKSQG
jgi:Flp pilus assembly protein TadB